MGNGFGTELTPQSLLHLRELLDRALDYPADRSKLLADVRAKDPVMARHLERAIEEHDRAERPSSPFLTFCRARSADTVLTVNSVAAEWEPFSSHTMKTVAESP